MGGAVSCNARRPRYIGSEESPGLLPLVDLMGTRYSFENLVFEGCGAKGYAYAGAVKVLEIIGFLPNIKRFSGMGSGAIVACLLAAGFDSDAVQYVIDNHLANLSTDIRCSNRVTQEEVLHKFGWNAGYKFFDWFGELLLHKCEDPDITFQQLYDQTGNELCIPVMNLNEMKIEYLHPKTTPDFVVRRAVSLAISIPGIFQPIKFSLDESPEDYYLDGGMLCNYPIHCFDGWWLSMEPEDRFLHRCQPAIDMKPLESESFSGFNHKSLGLMTFDDYHSDEMYDIMKQRLDQTESVIDIPATELGKKFNRTKERMKLMQLQLENFLGANEKLRNILETLKEDDNFVSLARLAKKVTESSDFSTIELLVLFGVDNNENKCLEFFKEHANGERRLPIRDIVSIAEKRNWQTFYSLSKLTPTSAVTNLSSFWATINNATHEKNKLISRTDLSRTVGIYTGHITNNDIDLHEADAVYLYQHGWNCTVAFMREVISATTAQEDLSSSSTTTLAEQVSESP